MPGIDSNTKLLLHLNNDSAVDSSGNGVSVTNSGVTFDNTSPNFTGTYFGVWDGGDTRRLTCGAAGDFNYLHNTSALFTIDFWVKMTSFQDSKFFFDSGTRSSAFIGCGMDINSDRSMDFFIRRGVGGTAVINVTLANLYPNDTTNWHHIAITYDQSLSSNNLTYFLDGTLTENGTKTANAPSNSNSTHALLFGNSDSDVAVTGITAKISEIRVSNSIRWTANFTPQSDPYAMTGIMSLKNNFWGDQ